MKDEVGGVGMEECVVRQHWVDEPKPARVDHQREGARIIKELRLNDGLTMSELYFPFTLRLYARVLQCLGDHNFTGLDLFYRIKDCWKGRDQPTDLLWRPMEPGLSLKIAEWCFNTFLDNNGQGESEEIWYILSLKPEDFIWFLDEICQAARLSSFFGDAALLDSMTAQLREIDSLFETDEEKYWEKVRGSARDTLIADFVQLNRDFRGPLLQMKHLYCPEIADRILHDRQLCNFIARTIIDIGFDGETVHGLRSQWVARETWPARVKRILLARDRGKCAACGKDIVQELKDEPHIDHMFSISQGGCNDLVNLQLLCSPCNRAKADKETQVATSVPQYIRRPKKSVR